MLKPLLKYTTQQSPKCLYFNIGRSITGDACGIDTYPCYDVLLSAMKRYRGSLPERRLMAALFAPCAAASGELLEAARLNRSVVVEHKEPVNLISVCFLIN